MIFKVFLNINRNKYKIIFKESKYTELLLLEKGKQLIMKKRMIYHL